MCVSAHFGKPEMHIDLSAPSRFDGHMRTYRQIATEFIREAEAQTGRKISALAKDAGIAHTTFTRFLKNDSYKYAPKIDKLMAISRIANVPLPPDLAGLAEQDAIAVPLYSWVSAGQLATPEAVVEPEDTVEVSGLPNGRYFATRVVGDSMDRYSPEGSIIIVNMNDTDPVHGRAYVFNHRGETTYKLFKAKPVVRLSPHTTNLNHEDIYPQEGRWFVVGRVVRSILDL